MRKYFSSLRNRIMKLQESTMRTIQVPIPCLFSLSSLCVDQGSISLFLAWAMNLNKLKEQHYHGEALEWWDYVSWSNFVHGNGCILCLNIRLRRKFLYWLLNKRRVQIEGHERPRIVEVQMKDLFRDATNAKVQPCLSHENPVGTRTFLTSVPTCHALQNTV